MVIIRIQGGFGNQLFTYSCGYALAKRMDANLLLDTSQHDSGYFRQLELYNLNIEYKDKTNYKAKNNIINKIYRKFKIGLLTKMIYEHKTYTFQQEIFEQKGNIFLQGYWQSYKYFDEYKNDLKRQFMPVYEQKSDIKKLIENLKTHESVAVHIRRGDYITVNGCIDMNYYNRAIYYLDNKFDNLNFYFFSDDIDWVKNYFGQKITYNYVSINSTSQSLDEFFAMSACKNQIISNSTYSWWAAYLNDNINKIIIAPEVACWKGDYYPPSWMLIKTDLI